MIAAIERLVVVRFMFNTSSWYRVSPQLHTAYHSIGLHNRLLIYQQTITVFTQPSTEGGCFRQFIDMWRHPRDEKSAP